MSMYFKDRNEAGLVLAQELEKYRYENSIVIALNDGGVAVGEPIAQRIHCLLSLLLIENIDMPGEPEPFGSINQDGVFTYNGAYSAGEIEGYYSEFHGFFEEQKREKYQLINKLLADGGILNNQMVKDRVVILVADGLLNGASVDAAVSFLKPIRTSRIIAAVPIATVSAVDKLHILADELHVSAVSDNLLEIDHYYESNVLPSHEQTIAKINQIILNWH